VEGWLELVFILIPELIVLVIAIVVFPFLHLLFLPFVSDGGILAGRIGCTAGVRVDLYGSSATITFI
jgi:hypothetical protein